MLDVLLQEDKDGDWHSVAYLVRKTTFAMAKYLPPPLRFFFTIFKYNCIKIIYSLYNRQRKYITIISILVIIV